MAAATLSEAAVTAAANLYTLLAAGTLKVKTAQFWAALIDTFPDSDPNDRPVANWLVLIAVLSDQMEADVTYPQFTDMVDLVYRICFLTKALNDEGLVDNAQAAAVLAQYNAKFT
jgi:hypothetical protein